ncbi:MAG: MarR family transcriptional regulator [Solirubrobacterales bacterium]|nr:MarR family transcriptional regulator [Solirubrobacterales bacterium]
MPPRDEELTFADHLGRFYARRYGFPPMVGRVLGYLLVCAPPDQSIAELSDALLASRSAITGALDVLERLHSIRRSRAAGERMDRVRVDFSSAQARGFDVTEYEELAELAREGLEVLQDAPPERRTPLAEMAVFADWLVERTRVLQQEWEQHRAALRASGQLPS